MRSLLQLLFLLFCVQRGYGHALPSLLDHVVGGADTASPDQQEPAPRPRRSSSDAAPASASASPCGLRSVQLQVRDLGLGYDADETVLFKYCGGACERVRSNHDLTRAHLLLGGVLPRPGPSGVGGPCCRPTHHEDLAFLDNAHRWHKVEKLLAAGCSCVG
ncbi:artemin [Gadus morhua]|uniref:artemin n=1 Tax=Gadus morhua TaxID=8049 RepID=UPI0011B7BB8B|nr:artemin-like [Gadus morhua]